MFTPPEALDEILKIGNQMLPREACGILVIKPPYHFVRTLVNTAQDPERSYSVNNKELVETLVDIMGEYDVTVSKADVIVWHTHPSGHIGPSVGDLRHKEPDLEYLVVALPNGEATRF